MNILLRSIITASFILSSILTPISPNLQKIGGFYSTDTVPNTELELGNTSTADSDRPTLDEQFTIPDTTDKPITQIPAATPTPSVEPTPTPDEGVETNPDETIPPQEEPPLSNLEIMSDKEYLVAGEDVILNLDPKILPEGATIRITASENIAPKENHGASYNAEKRILDLPLRAQSLSWQTAADAQGPFYFIAQIIQNDEILEEQVIAFDQAVTGTVTSQDGGRIEWPDKGVTLIVPEGAVNEDVELIIRQAIANPVAPYNLSGNSIILQAKTKDGKLINEFNQELELEINYDPEEYEGNESALMIYYYDESILDWIAVTTQHNFADHSLTAYISHFSEWDILARSWEATRNADFDNFNLQGYTGGVVVDFPIDVPAGPAGFALDLNLTYNSSSIDSTTIYNQASWAGMGWTMDVGEVVRNTHGTSDYTIDDTYSINLGPISGLMVKDVTNSTSEIHIYHLLDSEFSKIQYYKTQDLWIVTDKTGTRYIFGGLYNDSDILYHNTNSSAYIPTTCDSNDKAINLTWRWGLKQIIDVNGQRINITWTYIARSLTNYCAVGKNAAVIIDNKPTAINYPDFNYRVQLLSTTNRRDYSSSWNTGIAMFTQMNLDKINIQKYENDDWVDAWYYDLIFAQDLAASDPSYDNFIFPDYMWINWTQPEYWRKTLTLVGIQKCYSEGNCEPAYSFEYDDGMHMTAAENGQGGRVEYQYETAYELDSAPVLRTGYGRLCGREGAKGTFGWSGNCSSYSNVWYLLVINNSQLTPSKNWPGSYYKFFASVSISGHGDPEDWFQARMLLNGTPSSSSSSYTLTNAVWAPRDFQFYLNLDPEMSSTALTAEMLGPGLEYCPDPTRTCHGFAALYAYVQPVLTIYQLVEKTVIDPVSGDEYTYTYTYDEFATNDITHSDVVADSTDHCGFDTVDTLDDEAICYTKIFRKFRGHSSYTETDPSGRTTITYYHQDDVLQGKPSANMTVVSQFGENFEDGLNTSQWTIALSGGTSDFGDVDRFRGDNALILTEGDVAEWSSVSGATTTSPDGRSVIVQFMPEAGSEFNLGVQDTANSNFKWRITGNDSGLYVQYGDGTNLSTPVSLMSADSEHPEEGYVPGLWYVAIFTLDHDDGYSVRVWKRDETPICESASECEITAMVGYYAMPAATGNFTSGLTWQFAGSVNDGTIYFDEYIEAYLYALGFTDYAREMNPNNITVDPPNYYRWAMGEFPGFDVYWTPVIATESYIFEGGFAFQATRTEYSYVESPEHQYGNVTGIREQEWVNGTGFSNVRQTNITYQPNISSTYIVSLPAQQTVHACSGSTCDQDLLAISQFIYDTNSTYTQPPTKGYLTRTRQGIDDNQWAETLMDYDAWGNQTSVTQYTSYGTDSTFASQGAQTTTTTYDAALHTYPVTVTSAIAGHQVTMTYDTLLNLPVSMTDPNGLVTLLCYDSKARLIGSVKGDSANPPTCSSQMEISMAYHEATETGGVWSPFWTEATQVLSLDAQGTPDLQISYRKFYDGIGRQIQTQTVGVDLDGYADGSQTIINDYFYDIYGLLEYTSMPYNVTTPAGFSAQPACNSSTCVTMIHDALSRVIETQAPDGSVSQTYYGLDATEGLRTISVADTLQNSTTSYQDVWGQTVRVVPETGPWTEYDYDLSGQLVQVDQVNSSGVFASTYIAYDLGGRKVEMNDPDMGIWTYTYDALGNLTSQTDAKQQETNLCYDDLNRLTGKYYGSSGDCSTPAGWDVTYYYDAYTAGIFSGYSGATNNALGQRTGMLDSSGHTIWSFDQRGNLIEEEKTVGTESFTTEWEYTIAGLLESMAYPLVNSTGETIYTTYTPQGGVASVGSLYNTYITLSYDEANRAVNRTYFTSGDGLQTNFDYYDWNEQVSGIPQGGLLQTAQTGTLADQDALASLAYIYDANRNVATIWDLVQSPIQVQNFTYDSLYRLTDATGSAGFGGAYSETYTYDTEGRMDTKDSATLSYTATRTGTCQTNSLTPAASSTITHAVSSKSGGNSYTYDCNGNAITRGDQTLIYDEENRLVEVQENSVTVAEYVYDGDGNQVQAVVTNGDLTITTVYIGVYYQQTTTLDESAIPAVETTEWEKYYYAGAVRLAMREDADNPLYLIGDHLGSTSLVIDTSGQEVAKRSYLPFGETWGVSATELPTDYTYTGQREAAEIGLKYYVARWYDSEIGHFIQADTIIPTASNPISWNRYAYVKYNPIAYNDPTGHFTDEELKQIYGDNYSKVLSTFNSKMQQVLKIDEVGVGDLIYYNGDSQGVLVFDQEGNLVIWNIYDGSITIIDSTIIPNAIFDNVGDNVFEIIVNFDYYDENGNDILYDKIELFDDWNRGEDNYVQEGNDFGYDCGFLCLVGLLTTAGPLFGPVGTAVGTGLELTGATASVADIISIKPTFVILDYPETIDFPFLIE